MSIQRIPNDRLRQLLAEAKWTHDALAREVNAIGAEMGVALRYGRASVSHWLSGMCPRPPTPQVVAEAFSRRLARLVTPADVGLVDRPAQAVQEVTRWWQSSPIADLVELADQAAQARTVWNSCVYSLAALAVPDWVQLVGNASKPPPVQGHGDRIGRSEVSSATTMFVLFSDADKHFGGRYARDALASYLGHTVAPWLRASTSPAIRREMLIIAARLTYLCGFMNFDEQLHGVAQRYYLVSSRLAAEAGDATSHAVALRALSVQARVLGHHRRAVDLAEAAVRTGIRAAPEQTRGFLAGQFAVAQAAAGDRRQALASLTEAEVHVNQITARTPPVGAYHQASFAHQHAAVAARLGNRDQAISALTTAIRLRPPGERRSYAVLLARLAEMHMASGELEAACRTWTEFLNRYPELHSARADSALGNLRALTRPHQRNPHVRELRQIAHSRKTCGISS